MLNKQYNILSNYSEGVINYLIKEIFEEEIYTFVPINGSPLIIDCGANIGLSCIYFKQKWPLAKIIAFEPDPTSYEMLLKNINEFELIDISPVNSALSNTDGYADYFTLADNSTKYTPVMSLKKNEATNKTIRVKTVNFGEYITQFKKIDFCKVDIEGGESLLLNALIEAGSITTIKEFVIEYHLWVSQLYSIEKFKSIFVSYGYKATIIKSEPKTEGCSTSGNVIFRFTLNN